MQQELGIKDEQLVWVESRRGKVISRAKVSERTNRGAVYMTYQWWIGACNELSIEHLDAVFQDTGIQIQCCPASQDRRPEVG